MPKIQPKAISVRKLIDTYEGLRGGSVATLELLAYHLREGNIRARAKHVWTSNEPSLRKAWKAEPDKEMFSGRSRTTPKQDVKRALWLKSIDWEHDKSLWDIRRGRFVITIHERPVRRIMIRGVRLHSVDARRLFDKPRKQKARFDKDNPWRNFWHEVIRLIQHDPTDFGRLANYTSDRKLADEIYPRVPFTLDENAVLEEVAALRKAFGLVRSYADGNTAQEVKRSPPRR